MKVITIIASTFFICLILNALRVQATPVGTCQQKVEICAAQQDSPFCCRWNPPTVNGTSTTEEQCYSTSLYSCIADLSTGDACLCPAGLLCCNKGCYDPTIQTCTVNREPSLGAPPRQLCPVISPLSCDGACYSFPQFRCCPGAPGQGGFLTSASSCPVQV